MVKFLLAVIVSLLFTSCGNDQAQEKDKLVSKSRFILKDSIVVDYLGNLHITDFDKESDSYLALDLSNNSIFQFNKEGDFLYEAILTGEGPEYINGSIYSLGYSGNESLFAQTRTTLYELNYEGEILGKIKLSDGTIYTNMRLVNYVFDNKLLLLHDNNTDLSPRFKEYYQEAEHITIVDLAKGEVTMEVPFEKNSNYLNNEYYYRNSVASFSLSKLDSLLNVIYPYEHKIYQYDLTKNYELIGVIKTNPENFKEPERANFNSELNTMKSLTYDSYYLNIFNNKEYIILEYTTGIPKTISPPESMSELNELFRHYNNRYYQIFKNGKKIGGDIEKPKGMMDLKYFHQNNQVVFQLDKNNAERNYEVFYLYEIDF